MSPVKNLFKIQFYIGSERVKNVTCLLSLRQDPFNKSEEDSAFSGRDLKSDVGQTTFFIFFWNINITKKQKKISYNPVLHHVQANVAAD